MRTLYFRSVVSSSSFFLFSSPNLSRHRLDVGCLPYFHTWSGPSANLGCRSETCCTWLAGNTGRKKSPQIRHLGTIAQCLSGYIFVKKAHLDNREKTVKQQYLPTRPHSMANFGPLTAEVGSLVWGTPANFDGFRVLASLLQRHRSTEVNQTLHDIWPSPGLIHRIVYTIYGVLVT